MPSFYSIIIIRKYFSLARIESKNLCSLDFCGGIQEENHLKMFLEMWITRLRVSLSLNVLNRLNRNLFRNLASCSELCFDLTKLILLSLMECNLRWSLYLKTISWKFYTKNSEDHSTPMVYWVEFVISYYPLALFSFASDDEKCRFYTRTN